MQNIGDPDQKLVLDWRVSLSIQLLKIFYFILFIYLFILFFIYLFFLGGGGGGILTPRIVF